MMQKTLGAFIAALRKEKGMTQMELAEKMGVTDKAVSKWERDLSCPDLGSIPKLAALLGVSIDELMQAGKKQAPAARKTPKEILELVFKAVALAMGVAVTVLSALNALTAQSGIALLGIGLACAGISLLGNSV